MGYGFMGKSCHKLVLNWLNLKEYILFPIVSLCITIECWENVLQFIIKRDFGDRFLCIPSF